MLYTLLASRRPTVKILELGRSLTHRGCEVGGSSHTAGTGGGSWSERLPPAPSTRFCSPRPQRRDERHVTDMHVHTCVLARSSPRNAARQNDRWQVRGEPAAWSGAGPVCVRLFGGAGQGPAPRSPSLGVTAFFLPWCRAVLLPQS